MELKISAVLAAGGRGTRFAAGNDARPKQFIELKGYPIFVWSLRTLLSSPAVANAVVVAPPDLVTEVNKHLALVAGLLHGKSVKVVRGGSTRQQSIYLGLLALEEETPDYVLIHDAARPFLTAEIVERVIAGVIKYGACTAGMPASDTVKLTRDGKIVETLDRQALTMVQTPQAGRFNWLLDAHKEADRQEKATTDDAEILELAGYEVGIVDGATFNLKITRPDDLVVAEALADIVFSDLM